MIAPTKESVTTAAMLDVAGRVPVTLDLAATIALARIQAILAARRVSVVAGDVCRDDCAACNQVKARPFRCGDCGFTGRPLTLPCTCAHSVAETLFFDEHLLATYRTQADWPADWKASRRHVAMDARALRALGTVGECQGNGTGQPPTGARLLHFEGHCSHCSPLCPACGGFGDMACVDLPLVMATLREARATLGEHGEPFVPKAPMRVLEEHGDGLVSRTLACELPVAASGSQPAGTIEISIGEDHYGNEHQNTPGIWFGLFNPASAGDRSFGTFLTVEGLDDVIDHLVALRERARAEGIIPREVAR